MLPETTSPTARALLVLELLQNAPASPPTGWASGSGSPSAPPAATSAILREAGVPIESTRGPYGGYRVGRGLRLPPLMFTATEALGLVMAVLEGHRQHRGRAPTRSAARSARSSGSCPSRWPRSVEAVRRVRARGPDADASPATETTATLVQACADRRRLRFGYRLGRDRSR